MELLFIYDGIHNNIYTINKILILINVSVPSALYSLIFNMVVISTSCPTVKKFINSAVCAIKNGIIKNFHFLRSINNDNSNIKISIQNINAIM